MTRAALFRLLASIAIVATAGIVAWDSSPRLGLDLSGGTQFVLETKDSETRKADKAATDRTLEVLRGRVDALGVAEPTLVRSGDNRIIVELPGVQDPTEAADTIGKTAQLAFHPVVSQGKGEETTDETATDEAPTELAEEASPEESVVAEAEVEETPAAEETTEEAPAEETTEDEKKD